MIYPIGNTEVTLTAATTPVELYEERQMLRTRYLEGAIVSDQDCTLRLYQGYENDSWISYEDFALVANEGQPFSLAVTSQQVRLEVRLEVRRGSADAAVRYDLVHRLEH